jgi:hypothetical protein
LHETRATVALETHILLGWMSKTWRVSPVWILTEAWYAKQGPRLSMVPGQGHKSK